MNLTAVPISQNNIITTTYTEAAVNTEQIMQNRSVDVGIETEALSSELILEPARESQDTLNRNDLYALFVEMPLCHRGMRVDSTLHLITHDATISYCKYCYNPPNGREIS